MVINDIDVRYLGTWVKHLWSEMSRALYNAISLPALKRIGPAHMIKIFTASPGAARVSD